MNKETNIKELSVPELYERSVMLQRALFELRLNIMTSRIKDYSQFRKLRKEIARTFTELRAKQMHLNKE